MVADSRDRVFGYVNHEVAARQAGYAKFMRKPADRLVIAIEIERLARPSRPGEVA